MPEGNPNSEALKSWREKLAYLQKQEAFIADPAQKFALQHQVEEAKAKIAELTQTRQKPSGGPGGVVRSNRGDRAFRAGTSPSEAAWSSSNLKSLSNQDVNRAAVEIMRELGSTTTLDVKLKLRSEGFFAEQQQVSEAMKQLAVAHGWVSTMSHDHLVYTLPPEQGPAAESRQSHETIGEKRRLVILVHGIRTRAEWQGRLRHLFEADGKAIVEVVGYEYFDVFRFLWPGRTRRKPIEVVLKKIRDALKLHRGRFDELIIVAHSFGTYIVGTILRENPEIEVDRLLLCGCILPASYPWNQLPNRPKTVLNEAGSRDIWRILAKSITWGYGSTGTFGFQTPGVRDRYHNVAHSDYFKPGFAEQYWVPWIRDEARKSTPYETGERPPTPFYKNLLEILPLKWVLLLVLVAVALFFVSSSGRSSSSRPTDQFAFIPMEQYIELNKPRYLLLWNFNNRRIISPIHVEMFADFTNLRDTPLTIKSYQFEGKTPIGNWELMPSIDIQWGHLLWLTSTNFDLKATVMRVDCGPNVFPSVLNGRKVGPGDTITGFVFLEAPTNGFTGELRLRIRDATDTEYVQGVKTARPMTNYLNATVQWGGSTLWKEVEDISKLPISRYSDELPVNR